MLSFFRTFFLTKLTFTLKLSNAEICFSLIFMTALELTDKYKTFFNWHNWILLTLIFLMSDIFTMMSDLLSLNINLWVINSDVRISLMIMSETMTQSIFWIIWVEFFLTAQQRIFISQTFFVFSADDVDLFVVLFFSLKFTNLIIQCVSNSSTFIVISLSSFIVNSFCLVSSCWNKLNTTIWSACHSSECKVFRVESSHFFWIFFFMIFTFLFNILFSEHSQSHFFWLFCVVTDRLEVFMFRIWYLNINSRLSFLKSLLKSHCKFSRFVLCCLIFIQLHQFFSLSNICTEFSCCMNKFKDIIDFSFSSNSQTM